MTAPTQDLTAEQIENFRSYCHAYLEKIGPTHALIDRVCGLALKGSEAQKPEPSITRQELDDDARQPGGPLSRVPSPTPGDTAEDLAKGFVAFKDGKKITAEEFYKEPSGSVDVEKLQKLIRAECSCRQHDFIRDLLTDADRAITKMAEDKEDLALIAREQENAHVAAKMEVSRLSLEVGRLTEALKRSMVALDDWLHVHAPDECREEHVAETSKRLSEGGTIWYIANVQEQNRNALAGGAEK